MKIYPTLLILFIAACHVEPPIHYTLAEVDLVPQGIAYHSKTDAFYLTGVGKSKIVKVDRLTGKQEDFINEDQYGYSPGAGILVDEERELLHAIGGYYMSDDSLSSVWTFDLSDGSLVERHNVTDDGGHFLNDLINDDAGNLYLTDTKDSSVYILREDSNQLERFYKSAEITFPNGIAISDDNTKLYVASIPNGIRVIDIATKEILNDIDNTKTSTGIDGLEFYNGHLYGVQNSTQGNPFNFRKVMLNEAQDQIVDHVMIDSDVPRLDVPLTFCIAGNKAVVIGNSNLQYLDQVTFEFNPTEDTRNTKLLVYALE